MSGIGIFSVAGVSEAKSRDMDEGTAMNLMQWEGAIQQNFEIWGTEIRIRCYHHRKRVALPSLDK
jgi:hypothetical protein